MSAPPTRRVFLCHSPASGDFASRFAELAQHQPEIDLISVEDIPPTDVVEHTLRRHMQEIDVAVVLIDATAYRSQAIDMEIAMCLDITRNEGSAGLLGIVLPGHPAYLKRSDFDPLSIPRRLQANIECGYAALHFWSEEPEDLAEWIEAAMRRRRKRKPNTAALPFLESEAPPPVEPSSASPRTLVIPDIAWAKIEGGDFVYQEGERRRLPTFYLARYPVTNAQYQCFIDAGGYEDKRWWKGLKKPQPQEPRWPQANRPRTNVDWYEATAFCRWLSAQVGYEVRLPTEEEWERAARGREGREYPWGKGYESGRANVDEKTWDESGPWNLKQTTAVGAYPQGATPEGIEDLAGNVWEWCSSKNERPQENSADGSGDARVLRGGSWVDLPVNARADFRSGLSPVIRDYLIGFRLLSSAPIE